MGSEQHREIAQKFTRAHDHSSGVPIAELMALFADGAVGATNFAPQPMPLNNQAELRRVEGALMKNYKAADQKLYLTDDGFIWEYVSDYEIDGHHARVPVCMVVTVRDGKVARLMSYFDPAQMGPLFAKLKDGFARAQG